MEDLIDIKSDLQIEEPEKEEHVVFKTEFVSVETVKSEPMEDTETEITSFLEVKMNNTVNNKEETSDYIGWYRKKYKDCNVKEKHERYEKAMEAYRSHRFPSIAKTARHFDCSRSTLHSLITKGGKFTGKGRLGNPVIKKAVPIRVIVPKSQSSPSCNSHVMPNNILSITATKQ